MLILTMLSGALYQRSCHGDVLMTNKCLSQQIL